MVIPDFADARAQAHQRHPLTTIETVVTPFEGIAAATEHGLPPPGPLDAAHLEDVAKVSIAAEAQRNLQNSVAVAGEVELLQARTRRQNGAALQMHHPLAGASGSGVVGEMADVHAHLTTLGCTQHRCRLPPQQQLQAAHMAGSAMKDARIGMGVGADLTPAVQHREGLPVLEHERGQLVMRHEASARPPQPRCGEPESDGGRDVHSLRPGGRH